MSPRAKWRRRPMSAAMWSIAGAGCRRRRLRGRRRSWRCRGRRASRPPQPHVVESASGPSRLVFGAGLEGDLGAGLAPAIITWLIRGAARPPPPRLAHTARRAIRKLRPSRRWTSRVPSAVAGPYSSISSTRRGSVPSRSPSLLCPIHRRSAFCNAGQVTSRRTQAPPTGRPLARRLIRSPYS